MKIQADHYERRRRYHANSRAAHNEDFDTLSRGLWPDSLERLLQRQPPAPSQERNEE